MKMELWGSINGDLVRLSGAQISASDFGFLYGVGLFETFRTWKGSLFALDSHWQRLTEGARLLGWQLALPPETLTVWVQEVVSENRRRIGERDLRLRVTITPGRLEPQKGWAVFPEGEPMVVIHAAPLPSDFDARNEKGWKAILLPWCRSKDLPLWRCKTLSYFAHVLGRRYAKSQGADEGLWRNTDGNITEGTATNLFLLSGDELLTPPVQDGLLKGIVRSLVMEIAREIGWTVREVSIPPETLFSADEVFVTNAVIGIVPLRQVNGYRWEKFPVTRALRERFWAKATG